MEHCSRIYERNNTHSPTQQQLHDNSDFVGFFYSFFVGQIILQMMTTLKQNLFKQKKNAHIHTYKQTDTNSYMYRCNMLERNAHKWWFCWLVAWLVSDIYACTINTHAHTYTHEFSLSLQGFWVVFFLLLCSKALVSGRIALHV